MATETFEIIDQHIPSLSDENEAEILDNAMLLGIYDEGVGVDVADLAIRTCHCGVRIDGFYEYVAHLKEVLA
ncbi:MAG: hypothetical protein ABIQ65_15755 [Thermoanaerobaculia bacterium]